MIIGISGKISSGKDTVGQIIQYLTSEKGKEAPMEFIQHRGKIDAQGYGYNDFTQYNSPFEIRKMADTLKNMVCMLINCTRTQLEDQEFKDTPLGEEWTYYAYATGHKIDNNGNREMIATPCSKERYEEELRINWQTAYKRELTPRLLLQLLGTECGRNIIHPNVWCNATFASYKTNKAMFQTGDSEAVTYGLMTVEEALKRVEPLYPDWVITDIRFPNEVQAVKDRGGKMIRVSRWTTSEVIGDVHPSETALDDYKDWDYEIDNNGTIEELIEAVRRILIIEKLI